MSDYLPQLLRDGAIKNLPDPFWIVDVDERRIAFANSAYAEMMGYGVEELIGKHIDELEVVEDKPAIERTMRMIADSKKLTFTANHRKKDGSTARLETSARYDETDGRRLLYATMRDCTEKFAIEEKFQKLNSKLIETATSETKKRIAKELELSTVFEAFSAGIVTLDKNGLILSVNEKFLRLMDIESKQAALHKNFITFIHENDRGSVLELYSKITAELAGSNCACTLVSSCCESENNQYETTFRTLKDKKVEAIVGVSCYKTGANDISFVFSVTDVTQMRNLERKQLQTHKLLVSQSRMAAMGEMIGAIAHQWRQPLNALGVYIQELPELLEENALTKDSIDVIVANSMKQISFMSKTIDDFRGFFKLDKERVDFCLASATREAVSLFMPTLASAGIKLETAYISAPITVGFPNEFKQVILNVIANAKDALESQKIGKEAKIEIVITSDRANGIVQISDNAKGVPLEYIDKIFEPYFTTKPEGKGTGIGLYMSKTIVETNMGGSLDVFNGQNGAVFTIKIPLAVSTFENK